MKTFEIIKQLLKAKKPIPEPDSSGIDPDELKMGIKVEMEHTSDHKVAEMIAIDHLREDPHYYSKGKAKGLFPELTDHE